MGRLLAYWNRSGASVYNKLGDFVYGDKTSNLERGGALGYGHLVGGVFLGVVVGGEQALHKRYLVACGVIDEGRAKPGVGLNREP